MQILCQKNEYDSNFFKKDIFSFTLSQADYISSKAVVKDFESFSKWPPSIIIGRIPITNMKAIQDAIKASFDILCIMVDLELDLQVQSSFIQDEEVRLGNIQDSKGVMDIAGNVFSHSRFHRENNMSALANEYHRLWAENCLKGNQSDVVLVYGEDIIDGFLAMSYDAKTKEAKIVLIGVSNKKQGAGVATSLIGMAGQRAQNKGALKIRVRTELDNIKSLNLYLKNKFKIAEVFAYIRKDTYKK